MKLKNAWFSQKAADLYGYCIYLDQFNRPVKVYEVSDLPIPYCEWDDLVYIGLVKDKCIKTMNEKELPMSVKFIPKIASQSRINDMKPGDFAVLLIDNSVIYRTSDGLSLEYITNPHRSHKFRYDESFVRLINNLKIEEL